MIGMKAVVLSHAQIGSRTIVGACSLVGEHKNIPEGVLILGIPAKYARELTETELEHIVTSAQEYHERALEHKNSALFLTGNEEK